MRPEFDTSRGTLSIPSTRLKRAVPSVMLTPSLVSSGASVIFCGESGIGGVQATTYPTPGSRERVSVVEAQIA
jgi:hypothetical protein